MSKAEGGRNSSFSEKPVRPRLRRLVDWISLTGAKKVHSLIDKVYKRKNLEMAWEKVKENRGSGGVDGQTLEAFEVQLNQQLERLHRELKEDTYHPLPVRQHPIPKRDKPGEYRMLGIPAIYDRVCQQALLNRLEPIFEPIFDDASFGYRRGRSTKDALRSQVRQIWAFPPRVDGVEYALTHQVLGDKGAAVRDAVQYGINILQSQPAQFRRIILLLSQEEDSSSHARFADVVRQVARSGTTIYSFTFSNGGTRNKSHNTKPQRRSVGDLPPSPDATELAVESGGENMRFSSEDDLEQKISMVREDIRSDYILSFRPSAPTPGLHKIRVEVVEQMGHLKVLARKNYWLDYAMH